MSIVVSPAMSYRAQSAHDEPDNPDTLDATARARATTAKATLAQQFQTGLTALKSKISDTVQAVESVIQGNPTSAELKTTVQFLNAAQKVADVVLSGDPKKMMNTLLGALPGAVHALLPGLSPQQIKRALTVAQRVLGVLRKPSFKAAASIVKELAGGRMNSTEVFLLDAVTSRADGQPFSLSRFLGGAIHASVKDLKSRAQALRDGEDNA